MKVSLFGLSRLRVVALIIFTCTVLSVTSVRGGNADEIKDVVNNWTKINIKTLPSLLGIIDAASEERCYQVECPLGYVKQAKVDHIPESNGCGSFDLQWKKELLPDEELEVCCDEHDFCYDKCGADRDVCDLNFKTCLIRTCTNPSKQRTARKMKACKWAAKFMYTTTQALGCKAYQEAQKKACVCTKEVVSQNDL